MKDPWQFDLFSLTPLKFPLTVDVSFVARLKSQCTICRRRAIDIVSVKIAPLHKGTKLSLFAKNERVWIFSPDPKTAGLIYPKSVNPVHG